MSPLPRPSWKLPTMLLLLSAVPMLAGAVRLSGLASGDGVTPANARFMANPVPVVLHVLCASLFDTAFRQGFPRLHRMAGRVAAPCGLVAALTGVWMTAAYTLPAALQGPLLYGVRLAVGLAMSLALIVAVRAVLQGRITAHRAWMLRAYALGQGAGTQVLILLPVSLLAGAPTFIVRDLLMTLAWGLNVVFAEWVIRRRLPAA